MPAQIDPNDLTRPVKVAAPYDNTTQAEVLLESVPVWFDLGWQKVDGEDYGVYGDLTPAPADSSPSVELHQQRLAAATTTAPQVATPATSPTDNVSWT